MHAQSSFSQFFRREKQSFGSNTFHFPIEICGYNSIVCIFICLCLIKQGSASQSGAALLLILLISPLFQTRGSTQARIVRNAHRRYSI